MADLFHFTPTGGAEINLNSGDYAVGYGVDLGARKTEFDEVRSYTGEIRMLDVHQPLVEMVIPMKITGSDSDDLYDNVLALKNACVTGGLLEVTVNGAPAQTFTIGPSPEPEVKMDALYKLRLIALTELHLRRLP